LNRPQKFNVKYKREGKQAVEQYAAWNHYIKLYKNSNYIYCLSHNKHRK
jgi:hypothetical protein